MLTIAVGLVVVDGLATWWLVTRRRRARRALLSIDRTATAARNTAPAAAGPPDDELEQRKANWRAQWGRWAPAEPSRPDGTIPTQPPATVGIFSELLRAADRLAATDQVIYDPAIWEA
jgi:hypothetical protein